MPLFQPRNTDVVRMRQERVAALSRAVVGVSEGRTRDSTLTRLPRVCRQSYPLLHQSEQHHVIYDFLSYRTHLPITNADPDGRVIMLSSLHTLSLNYLPVSRLGSLAQRLPVLDHEKEDR
jgi:hypothetical protein